MMRISKFGKTIFIMTFLLLLSSCDNSKKSALNVKSTSKTVSDVMAEADKNHGGTVTNPNDNANKNIPAAPPIAGNASQINGSSNMKRSNTGNNKTLNASDIDIDLTRLSPTMVYSEVYNMMNEPEKYVGKMVRMDGNLAVYKYPERNYYTCIIKDATACCQQGMEFLWQGNHKFPDDYPAEGSNIIVTGIFDVYYEGDNKYCQLKDAHLVKGRA